MTKAFCTTITPDYYPYALALIRSIQQFGKYPFFVHISSGSPSQFNPKEIPPHTVFLFNKDICKEGLGKRIFDKYAHVYMDWFRWSMKPVIMHYILEKKLAEKLIFVDSDMYFFNNPQFLFKELDTARFLVTPHWRSSDPEIDTGHFLLLYTNGLYNGGFCGANKDALPILRWWAKACEYFCVDDPFRGLYVDQIHLNLIPVYFEGVKIIRHKGCNIAWWNRYECKRTRGKNGKTVINDTYPIVFIHFTGKTIRCIIEGNDPLLSPYLEKYTIALFATASKKDLIKIRLKTIETHENMRVKGKRARKKRINFY